MKKLNKMVEIPIITLNTLKKLVFGNEEGINVSPIVDDLAIGLTEEAKEIMSLHVALTLKGLKPDLDIPKISFQASWRGVNVHIYQGFSLIQGLCSFKVIPIIWNNNTWSNTKGSNIQVYGLDMVENLKESYEDVEMSGLKEDEIPNYMDLAEVIKQVLKKEGYEENLI